MKKSYKKKCQFKAKAYIVNYKDNFDPLSDTNKDLEHANDKISKESREINF